MNVCVCIMLVMTSLGQCYGQQSCPADFPLSGGDVKEADDNICLNGTDCEFRDTTVSIDVFNALEVIFVFVAADGSETVKNHLVTQVNIWVHLVETHADPIVSLKVLIMWIDPMFMFKNLVATYCQELKCLLHKCLDLINECLHLLLDLLLPDWLFTPAGGNAALQAVGGWRINQGEELCISNPQPFLVKGGSMTVTGHQNGFTYSVHYHAVPNSVVLNYIATSGKGIFPMNVPVAATIPQSGFCLSKICFSADKDITITNLQLEVCMC